MNYRNSLLALAVATAAGTTPAHAIDLGTFKGTDLSFGGYIKAEGIFEDPEGEDSHFYGRANQTRFNFKTVTNKNGHTIVGFIEGDFYGGTPTGDDPDWRLRHAFIRIDDTTVGQTWTGQWWAVSYTDYFDFFAGPRGTLGGLNFRAPLASYETHGFRFSAQDPVFDDADTPDLAVNYTQPFSNGSQVIFTVSGREAENEDYGVGAAIGSKIMIGRHRLNLNAHYGDGLGVFTGVGVGGAPVDVENDDLVTQMGFNAGFQYVFNDQWRANIAYTRTDVDDDADTRYEGQRVNVVHNILPELEVGAEWRKYNLPFGGLIPEGQQVEVMAKYRF
ncbi:porin [Marinobacter bohaiensis]|uniref:porin n=1 Tax=Marinobacter bohaiensis TaxID=2201898 RepID=UPI000DADF8E9|nr:porin [Marinobacter bohaiensis]